VESKLYLVDQQSVAVSKENRRFNSIADRSCRPALLNAVMGLLSTLVNVLSKPEKTFTLVALGRLRICLHACADPC
jgi:hypothetical protein